MFGLFNSKIFVPVLEKGTDESQLRKFLEQFGKVVNIRIKSKE